MRFDAIRVENYKCFADPETIKLGPGFNIVVGKNNAGKSALLESISYTDRPNAPHRSRDRDAAYKVDPTSKLNIEFTISGREIRESIGLNNIWLPVPSGANAHEFVSWLLEAGELTFSATTRDGGLVLNSPLPLQTGAKNYATFIVRFSPDGAWEIDGASAGLNESQLGSSLSSYVPKKIFRFASERYGVGSHILDDSSVLTNNASNLPVVLHKLQGGAPARFRRLISQFREIVDGIDSLSIDSEHNQLVVKLWTLPDEVTNQIPVLLNNSGTGVGQVLAILTAASQNANSVIVIDEINTFLHPMASRRLIEILRTEYGSNQYVVSTHTADIVSWSAPSTVTMISKIGETSTTKALNVNEVGSIREIAGELGLSMGDVFGADRVLWVEGPTEEVVFPMVARWMGSPFEKGTVVVPVVSTGEFHPSRKNWEMAYKLYGKVSQFSSPLVSNYAFAMDREEMSGPDVAKLEEVIGEGVFILDRRCLENYFISADAICHLANNIARSAGIDREFIRDDFQKELISLAGEPRFKAAKTWNSNLNDEEWLQAVDGASLIDAVLQSVTESTITYRKVQHCEEVVTWIMNNNPGMLDGLVTYIGRIKGYIDS